jgi:hypothetical protein
MAVSVSATFCAPKYPVAKTHSRQLITKNETPVIIQTADGLTVKCLDRLIMGWFKLQFIFENH